MKVGVGLLIVLVALSTHPQAESREATAGSPMVVARYNLLRTGVATDVGAIVTPTVRWTFQTNGTVATSPLVADIDGDGRMEVVLSEAKPLAAADGTRLGYILDATGRPKWTVPLRYDGSVAAIADLDGDGVPEIVFAEGSHSDQPGSLGYRVVHGLDGSPAWTFTTPFFGGEGFFASPALADANADGRLDLLAGSMDHAVYALRGTDGAILWQVVGLEHYIRNAPPLADFDGDGRLEITVQSEAAVVRTFDVITGQQEWSVDLGDIVASTPAAGDLDGDGRFEIVHSMVIQGGVVALHGDGTLLWQNTAHDFAYRGPALVDVDGDGLSDVVEGDADDPSITAYRGTDGTILWSTHLDALWAQGPLVSADIDADGSFEILAGTDTGLVALNARTGAERWMLPLPRVRGEPLVRDIDGDGLAEILVSAGDGKLYVIGPASPPSRGFVTGGGWMESPPGAFAADLSLAGKVTFGFVAKVLRGDPMPRGNTEFQFHAAGLNFHATSYEWLLCSGQKCVLRGRGTIDGDGAFGYQLSAIDGRLPGGGGQDTFRMRIWNLGTGEVVYDNERGSSDFADPTTPLGGGNIVIHGN